MMAAEPRVWRLVQRQRCCFSLPAWKASLFSFSPSPLPPRAPYNQEKNRYGDVPCLDQTRVKLAKPYSRPEVSQPRMETWGPAWEPLLRRAHAVRAFLSPADRLHQRKLHGWLQAEERLHRDSRYGPEPLWDPLRESFCSSFTRGLHLPAQHQLLAAGGDSPGGGHCPASSPPLWVYLPPLCVYCTLLVYCTLVGCICSSLGVFAAFWVYLFPSLSPARRDQSFSWKRVNGSIILQPPPINWVLG